MKAVNATTEGGAERMAAYWLLEELSIPADFGTRDIVAQAIRLEAKRMGGVEIAAKHILHRALFDAGLGERINRFWFTDRKYLDAHAPPNPGAQRTTISEGEAYLRWMSMSDAFKASNPWRAK